MKPGRHALLGAALGASMLAACSRAASVDEPAAPWKTPAEGAWDELPKTDDAALVLATKRMTGRPTTRAFDAATLAHLPPDASLLVAGEDAIAATYDAWMNAAGAKPAYVFFGTLHDSRAQIETVASIVFRMKSPWGFALEQFRARGRWRGAPDAESADDADLATLERPGSALDSGALARLGARQMRFDHAAWKFGYLEAITPLVQASRGAGVPLLGCDMPPELRASLTPGSEAERALRELHFAAVLRSDALDVAAAHPPDGGLSEDDPPPPERFAVLVGARHAEPDGVARFVAKDARVALVRVLGGRPRDVAESDGVISLANASGDEAELAPRLVVTDVVLVRGHGPDMLLLPDDTWGGAVDRASDRGEPMPPAVAGLPRSNLRVTSDESARFAIGDSSVEVAARPEWLSVRSGHQAYVLASGARTFVGAVDVPEAGWTELHFSPSARAMRVILHLP